MTCIVGLVKDGVVYMGGDSLASSSVQRHTTTQRKVFIVGEFIIGVCGSFRVIDVIKYKFEMPKVHPDAHTDVDRFVRTTFVDTLKQCLSINKCIVVEKGVDSFESQLLIGFKGRLFKMQGDFSIMSYDETIGTSIGSGSSTACGSLYSSHSLIKDMEPEDRITLALQSAEYTTPSVGAPFFLLTL